MPPLTFAQRLLQAGVLQPTTVEKALVRQQMYGGSLDTVLLEMGALDEPTVWEALVTHTGLAPLPPALLGGPVVPPQMLCDLSTARILGALVFHAQSVDRDGADPAATPKVQAITRPECDLSRLHDRMGVPDMDVFIVPEVRFEALMGAYYNRPVPPRFLSLLGRLMGADHVRRWMARRGRRRSQIPAPPVETGPLSPAALAARKEAEEKARHAAEAQIRRAAEERAQREEQARVQRAAEERAQREEQARHQAEAQIRRAAEARAKREAERKARKETEAHARRETEEQARRAAEAHARHQAEEQARHEAEERARHQAAQAQARRAAEEDARRETETRAQHEALIQAPVTTERTIEHTQPEPESAGVLNDLAKLYLEVAGGPRAQVVQETLLAQWSPQTLFATMDQRFQDVAADNDGPSAWIALIAAHPDAAAVFVAALSDAAVRTRHWAAAGIGQIARHAPPPTQAVQAAIARISHEPDDGVRMALIRAVRPGLHDDPPEQLADLLAGWRQAVAQGDATVAFWAIESVLALRDPASIPTLIGRLADPNPAVRRGLIDALSTITGQDFGPKQSRWFKWWKTAQRQHRVDWLLAALDSHLPSIRYRAASELQDMIGQYFGYHFDLPPRERNAATARWRAWWRQHDRREAG